MTKREKEIVDLQHQLRVVTSLQPYILQNAYQNVHTANKSRYTASAVTITIKNINKTDNIICEEFAINGGLSDNLINAIKEEIANSYSHLTEIPNAIMLKKD